MSTTTFNKDLTSELEFKASRSSGKGGQSVNKVSTKIEIHFSVDDSQILTDGEKATIKSKLANKLTTENVLRVVSQSERTQYMNKKRALTKFEEMIEKCFVPRKKRVPTKPSKEAKERRLKEKREQARKKEDRRNSRPDY